MHKICTTSFRTFASNFIPTMDLSDLYKKAAAFEFLSVEEGVFLYHNAPLSELMFVADELRKQQVPHGKVTWQIDRNVNTTNVCIANCKFCNFFRIPGHAEAYITDMDTYRKKSKKLLSMVETSFYYKAVIIRN
ncbi:hypothetical protein [Niabella ginsengisoli]|uniref:Dehypoxanthine futalosine cyclase n=1 Tax=Niabella ginsengisoli TaxID=522298 RepID=A0ABS9SP34_9BACT|nr:hypothetical protein [Niabella ginsengisoli]MCH5600110.1 hypothetical protein [Niabella ginsengisoli]